MSTCYLWEEVRLSFLHDEGLYNRATYLVKMMAKAKAAGVLYDELKEVKVTNTGKTYTLASILYALRSF